MPKKIKQPKREKIIPYTNIQLAFKLAIDLNEDTPQERFYIWSYICIVGQHKATEAVKQAFLDYQSGKTRKNGEPRTLGGCWYVRVEEDNPIIMNRAAFRIRQGIREMYHLPAHSIPEIFGGTQNTDFFDISEE